VPPVYAAEFARRIGGSRVEMVDRTAHLPQLEQLGVVAPMVKSFLGEG
jgi:hypothetical protein